MIAPLSIRFFETDKMRKLGFMKIVRAEKLMAIVLSAQPVGGGFNSSCLILLTCLVLIMGCASAPQHVSSRYDRMVKSVPIESVSALTPRVASIQLSRPSMFWGVLKTTPIVLSGRNVGSLSSGTSMTKFVTPGHLRIESDYTMRPFDLEVKGGHEYLIDANAKEGRFKLISTALVMPPASSPPRKAQQIERQKLAPPIKVSQSPSVGRKEEVSELKPPPDIGFGRYYALVIGNNNYQHLPKLMTAHKDAKAVARIFEQDYGFRVNLMLDARRADILIALGKLRAKLTDRDNLLIYYAGHGWLDQEGGEGYWLPIDAVRDNEVNWISNASVTTLLKAMSAKHVLIVADSCYSGKLARGLRIKRRSDNYFSRMASKRVRSVMSSGGLEPVADSGGKGGHSVFASAFMEALRANDGIIDGTELFTQIRRPVILNSDQTPEYADIRKAGHDGGDFLFVRRK